MLSIVGLPGPQADVYKMLCARGAMSRASLEAALGRSVEGELSKLLSKGFIMGDDPYTPLPPDLAAAEAYISTRRKLWEAQGEIHALMEVWAAGAASRAWDQSFVEVVEGKASVSQYFARLQTTAQTETLVMITYPPATMPQPEGDLPQQRGTLRGVKYQVLMESAYLTEADDAARKEIAESASHQEEIRCLDELPYKLLVSDRQVAMLAPHARDSSVTEEEMSGIVIRQVALVRALVEHFSLLWDRAAPLQVSADSELSFKKRGDELTSLDRAILEHLVAGYDDPVIAKFVRRGERTVKRRINDMMGLFDVRNRAQLGYAVAKSDLLS